MPNATLSTTNPTRTDTGSNPGLRVRGLRLTVLAMARTVIRTPYKAINCSLPCTDESNNRVIEKTHYEEIVYTTGSQNFAA
jgi:hypothetical protein